MERASKALRRRSGVRLKSIGGGHSELNLVISELKDLRHSAKAFMTAQNSAAQDMVHWAATDENRAFEDVMIQLAELNSIWTEVQKEFAEHLKLFKNQFEMILEGEKQVDQIRHNLAICEQKELKVKKEIKRAAKKAPPEELNNLELKLSQAERAKTLAHLELVEKVQENEAIKFIRLKEGLLKLSDAYVELAHKCAIIFQAQKDISYQLPDVHGRELHDIKYTGSGITKQTVIKARNKVQHYRHDTTVPHEDPPPPYTPGSYNPSARSADYEDNHVSSVQRQRAVPSNSESSVSVSFPPRPTIPPSAPDIWWQDNSNYEEDISDALGAAKM